MKTEYTFSVETWIQHTERIQIETDIASIELIPDPDEKKNNELTKATVTLDGDATPELALSARQELMKVLLRYTVKGARVIDRPGFMPDSWRTILTSDDDPETEMKRGVSVLLSGRKLASYDPSHDRTLKINVDSNSPAIFCYYEAWRKTHPVDAYREFFKIVEFFSGSRENNEKDRSRILSHLGKDWWIPRDALSMARRLHQNESLTTEELAKMLYDLRGKCSHMRPEYGLTPKDLEGQAKVAAMTPVLEMIVHYSLGQNPKTKDAASPETVDSIP